MKTYLILLMAFAYCGALKSTPDSLMIENPYSPGDSVTLFKDDIWTEADVDSINFTYSNNVPIHPSGETDLDAWVYSVDWDSSQPLRPIFIYAHPGGLQGGNALDPNTTKVCREMARRGYVAISPNYRTGYDAGCDNSAKACCQEASVFSGRLAAYRATQDLRSLVRFVKAKAHLLKADPNLIILGGNSAGAVTALSVNFLDAGDVSTNISDSLGGLDGTGGYLSESIELSMVYSSAGFVYKKTMVDAGEDTPVLMTHGTCDRLSPVDQGYPNGCILSDPAKFVYGPLSLAEGLDDIGATYKMVILENGGHEALEFGKRDSLIANYFFETVLCPSGASSTIECFPATDPSCNLITFNPVPCSAEVGGVTQCLECDIVSAMLDSCGGDKGYIACVNTLTMETFRYCPANAITDIPCDFPSSEIIMGAPSLVTDELVDIQMGIYPNPTSGSLTILTNTIKPGVLPIALFSTSGRLIKRYVLNTTEGQQSVEINVGTDLTPGVYILSIGGNTEKLVVH